MPDAARTTMRSGDGSCWWVAREKPRVAGLQVLLYGREAREEPAAGSAPVLEVRGGGGRRRAERFDHGSSLMRSPEGTASARPSGRLFGLQTLAGALTSSLRQNQDSAQATRFPGSVSVSIPGEFSRT